MPIRNVRLCILRISPIRAHYKPGTPAYREGSKSQELQRKTLAFLATQVPLVLSLRSNLATSNWQRTCPLLRRAIIRHLSPLKANAMEERRIEVERRQEH